MTIQQEVVGPQFNKEIFLNARDKALELLHLCASKAHEGIDEEQLTQYLNELAQASGVEKWWHPTKVRFNQNTHCSFREPSQKDVKLKKGNLFFLDIGPVFNGHEADVGQTFCLGDEDFKNPAQLVFNECRELWSTKGTSGKDLYDYAQKSANQFNLKINPKMAGHRLSEFPHALHHRGKLIDFDQTPQELRWVLEIHLIDPKDPFKGYFFEDIL